MSTALIVLIAAVVVVALAAFLMAGRRRAAQQREDQREIANEHRLEAEDRARAAQAAEREAQAHLEQADELDPDVPGDGAARERDVHDGERDGLHAGERQPASESEFARRNA
jgi:hypothetical protein